MAFPAIPGAIAPLLVQISNQTGVPASWLAAVCAPTNFDPSFVVYNNANSLNAGGCHVAVRQWGIAGIWNEIQEYLVTPNVSGSTGIYNDLGYGCPYCCVTSASRPNAGWTLTGPCFSACPSYPCLTSAGVNILPPAGGPPFDTTYTLNAAAAILKVCHDRVVQSFNSLNATIFYMYVLGCAYFPEKDLTTGLPLLLPDLPQALNDAAWYLVQAQAFYANTFGEVPVVPNPPSTVPCPTGYSWNGLLSKCCNAQNQCIQATVCNGCASYDAVTNQCVAVGCPTCPCTPPATCVSGECVLPCTSDSQCPSGYICVNGYCVKSCIADTDCVAPATCGCTSPSGAKYCCTTGGGGGFPWWAVLAGVGIAALAFAALYKQPCGGPQDEPCPQGSTCINGYCEPYTTTYQPNYTLVR